MPFDQDDPAQVQRLADIINNDSSPAPGEYNVGISFSLQNNALAQAINLERSPLENGGVPVIVGQPFATGPELLAILDSTNVLNQAGAQAWLGFVGSILTFDGRLEIGNTAIRDSLKSVLDAAGGTAVDGLAGTSTASIADAEFGAGTKIKNPDVAAARALP